MNFRPLIFLLTLGFFPASCQDEPKPAPRKAPPKEKAEVQKKKSLINVPAGAVITDLTLPYNDESGTKVSLLRIKELTVHDDSREGEILLAGKGLKLWIFDKTGGIRSTTTIPVADYFVGQERLRARGEILVIGAGDRFAAKSNGGIFSLETGQALLLGPVTTRFELPQKEPTTPQ